MEIGTKFIILDDSSNIIKDENKNKDDLFLLEPLFTENYTIHAINNTHPLIYKKNICKGVHAHVQVDRGGLPHLLPFSPEEN